MRRRTPAGLPSESSERVLPEWMDACKAHGIRELRIIQGKGRGPLRRTAHALLARRADVLAYALAPAARGGWGATLVTLR